MSDFLSSEARSTFLRLVHHYETRLTQDAPGPTSTGPQLTFLNQDLSDQERNILNLSSSENLGPSYLNDFLEIARKVQLNPQHPLTLRENTLTQIFLRHVIDVAPSNSNAQWSSLKNELLRLQEQRLSQLIAGQYGFKRESTALNSAPRPQAMGVALSLWNHEPARPVIQPETSEAKSEPKNLRKSSQSLRYQSTRINNLRLSPEQIDLLMKAFKEHPQFRNIDFRQSPYRLINGYRKVVANPVFLLDWLLLLDQGLPAKASTRPAIQRWLQDYLKLCEEWGYAFSFSAETLRSRFEADPEWEYLSTVVLRRPMKSAISSALDYIFENVSLRDSERFELQKLRILFAYYSKKQSSIAITASLRNAFTLIDRYLPEDHPSQALLKPLLEKHRPRKTEGLVLPQNGIAKIDPARLSPANKNLAHSEPGKFSLSKRQRNLLIQSLRRNPELNHLRGDYFYSLDGLRLALEEPEIKAPKLIEALWVFYRHLPSNDPAKDAIHQLWRDCLTLCRHWGYPLSAPSPSQEFKIRLSWVATVPNYIPAFRVSAIREGLAYLLENNSLSAQEQFEAQKALLFFSIHPGSVDLYQGDQRFFRIAMTLFYQHLPESYPNRNILNIYLEKIPKPIRLAPEPSPQRKERAPGKPTALGPSWYFWSPDRIHHDLAKIRGQREDAEAALDAFAAAPSQAFPSQVLSHEPSSVPPRAKNAEDYSPQNENFKSASPNSLRLSRTQADLLNEGINQYSGPKPFLSRIRSKRVFTPEVTVNPAQLLEVLYTLYQELPDKAKVKPRIITLWFDYLKLCQSWGVSISPVVGVVPLKAFEISETWKDLEISSMESNIAEAFSLALKHLLTKVTLEPSEQFEAQKALLFFTYAGGKTVFLRENNLRYVRAALTLIERRLPQDLPSEIHIKQVTERWALENKQEAITTKTAPQEAAKFDPRFSAENQNFSLSTPQNLRLSPAQLDLLHRAIEEHPDFAVKTKAHKYRNAGLRRTLTLFKSQAVNSARLLEILWIFKNGLPSDASQKPAIDRLWQDFKTWCAGYGYSIPSEINSQDFQTDEAWREVSINYLNPESIQNLEKALRQIPQNQLKPSEQLELQKILLFLEYWKVKRKNKNIILYNEYVYFRNAFTLIERYFNSESPELKKLSPLIQKWKAQSHSQRARSAALNSTAPQALAVAGSEKSEALPSGTYWEFHRHRIDPQKRAQGQAPIGWKAIRNSVDDWRGAEPGKTKQEAANRLFLIIWDYLEQKRGLAINAFKLRRDFETKPEFIIEQISSPYDAPILEKRELLLLMQEVTLQGKPLGRSHEEIKERRNRERLRRRR